MSSPDPSTRLVVLVAAARGAWEPAALRALAAAGVVVQRRCVDLLGAARSHQATAAIVAAGLPGLDADALGRLRDDDVRLLAVGDGDDGVPRQRLQRLGAAVVDDPADIVPALGRLLAGPIPDAAAGRPGETTPDRGARPVVAVWGPAGAPGRTTVAVNLAVARAATSRAILVDADPHAASLAQSLGVLDEVSGLLAAARLLNEGGLDRDAVRGLRRTVRPRLEVLTGLPRPDRWIEGRPGLITSILGLCALDGDIVVDCGFSLEHGSERAGPPRNTMTLEALRAADAVVVVGSPEPAGLVRLARGLVELGDLLPATPVRVVINRMRDSLGWRRGDVAAMVGGYLAGVPVAFWPDEPGAVDRALIAATPVSAKESPVLRGAADALSQVLLDAVR